MLNCLCNEKSRVQHCTGGGESGRATEADKDASNCLSQRPCGFDLSFPDVDDASRCHNL